jgi:hypothetical protein
MPKQASIETPGYRQAGRFNLTFDYRDLPIDPRTVRSFAVEIHLGAVQDSDFAAGYRGRESDGSLKSILQTRTESGTPNLDTLQMVGIGDDWRMTHDGSGSTVTLIGRDLRGILLDTPVNAGEAGIGQQLLDKLDMSQTIDLVVGQILTYNPFFEDIRIVTNAQDWPNATLPRPGAEDAVPRHRLGARGKKKGAKATPPSGTSGGQLNFWDMVVRVCYLVGAIPYFQGTDLLIRPASTVFDKMRGPIDPVKNPTPFKGGSPRTGDAQTRELLLPPLQTRKLVYGRDSESLEFGRKYGGWRRPKVIRAISVDLASRETGKGKFIEGIWPPEAAQKEKGAPGATAKSPAKARVTRAAPAFDKTMEEVLNIPVHAITDAVQLAQIAEAVYNEMGRGEIGGTCETVNLASFGGDNTDPDLLRLQPGDGIEIDVDTRSIRSGAPLISAYTEANRKSFTAQVNDILKFIPDQNLARTIVATARGQIGELQRFFRVETVKFNWNKDSGVKIAFDFQNYVVVRAQVGAAATDIGTAKAFVTPTKGQGSSPSNAPSGGSLRSL